MLDLRRTTVNGHNVAYRMEGSGAPILLIHGIASSSSTWLDAMNGLAVRYRVLAPDLLGHGESDKPTGDYSLGAQASFLRDLLGCMEIERATIVGHSLGGGIAMQLCYQHPEVCERIVLVSSGGLGHDVSPLLRMLSLPGAEWVLTVLVPPFVRSGGNAVRTWIRNRGIRAPGIAQGWLTYSSLADAANRRAFVRELRAVVDFSGQVVDARDRLYRSARVPTMIVWGDRDPVIPLAHARAAHEAIPGSRLEIFEGAGHFPHAECPDRFAEVVGAFIESTRPVRDDARRVKPSGSARA